jgi:uncharacterized repeat protein (TIGR01451 family)
VLVLVIVGDATPMRADVRKAFVRCRSSAILVSAATVALSVMPPLASAATTLGETGASTTACGSNTLWQSGVAPGGPSYTAQSGGVLTSWSYQALAPADQITFTVFRATNTAGQMKVVAEDSQTMTPNKVNTFLIRIPVQPGDILGSISGNGSQNCWHTTSSGADTVNGCSFCSPPVGGTVTGHGDQGNTRLNESATLEPDGDGDGFGDETQDRCPTDPTTHDTCQADLSLTKTADRASAAIGDNVVYTIGVKNNSAYNIASSVTVADALPGNVSLVAATPTKGSCTGAVICSLGDLAAGEGVTITVVVRVTAAGAAVDTATATTSTPDPNAANNSASATTSVTAPAPPFQGITLRSGQTVSVDSRGRGTIVIPCPLLAQGACSGSGVFDSASKIVLRAATKPKKRIRTLATFRFSGIQPGTTRKVRFKLSKKAARLLGQKGALRAVLKLTSHDARNVNKKTSAKVTFRKKGSGKR